MSGSVTKEMEIRTIVVGTGAAGYQAAVCLHKRGETELAVISENIKAGTSRNTGSDKQTYYKLTLAGGEGDSVRAMAEDLFRGQCVDGDLALCEAALSARCFYHLSELGVPFPDNEYGEAIGYQTDHDSRKRASSAGPYTSKMMTECLECEAHVRHIRILNHIQAICLLVKEGRIYGVLCLESGEQGHCEFIIIWCENVILATGGPAGMYRDSVYPPSQIGSSGMAFEAGVKGKNLTEWQFGMASLHPRWNVSGTYMQVLPRMISTDRDGRQEREFLLDYFEDPLEMMFLLFLKGYQWPFDTNKIYGGSSIIDLLVYQETVLKGRRVFLDYRNNPCKRQVEFERLPTEAYEYLNGAGACFGTPFERLLHMNEPAVLFYREHGVDLRCELLEIAVCAQHNNGGLSTDCNWQTNIKGIFAVGEVCGSHGVTRPGGSALNAGQAGALRAAEYIVRQKENSQSGVIVGNRVYCRKEAEQRIRLLSISSGPSNVGEAWKRAGVRMSSQGGMIRSEEGLAGALGEVTDELEHFWEKIRITDMGQAKGLFHLYDTLIAQKVYLSAMLDYLRHGGGSRGSALYTCPDGTKPREDMPELYRCSLDNGRMGGLVQETWLCGAECKQQWRPVRPIPEPDYFFEKQWKAYRERKG